MRATPGASVTFGPMGEAVDVLVDGAERLGLLSYLANPLLNVSPGDAVLVPYGRTTKTGMLVGPSSAPHLATRQILDRIGPRSTPLDIAAASALAEHHFASPHLMFQRCAPPSRKSHPPLAAPHALIPALPAVSFSGPETNASFVARHPQLTAAELGVALVARVLSENPAGQVLVLCPTSVLVEEVLTMFSSGAARLDSSAASGAWRGFVEGTIQVGIGTRSAMMFSAPSLSAIVVLEADHIGHRSVRQPYVTSTEAALTRSSLLGVKFFGTGLLPSATVLARTKLCSATPAGFKHPQVTVHARRQGPARRIIPVSAQIEIEHALRRNARVAVVTRDTRKRKCVQCRAEWGVTDVACPKCSSPHASSSGWDPSRLATFFSAPVKAVAIEDVFKLKDIDLLVLADIDHVASRPSLTPEFDTMAHVLRAAQALSDTGVIVLVSDEQDVPQTYAALASGVPRNMARLVYASARSAALPPFKTMVTLSIGNRKSAPNLEGLPGRLLGPRRVGPSEWQAQVLIAPSEHGSLASKLEVLRRRYQLRVEVSPA